MAEKRKRNSRAKANRLVSKYLTEMASKADAVITDGGEDRLCTRAEKLAHIIWKNTLGYTELDVKSGVDIVYPPSLSYLKILLDRMEGRVTDVSATKAPKSIADRVKETTKSKLNDMAEESSK